MDMAISQKVIKESTMMVGLIVLSPVLDVVFELVPTVALLSTVV